MTTSRTTLDTPIGPMTVVASDGGLRAVLWPDDSGRVRLPDDIVEDASHPVVVTASTQLREYFDGERTAFDVPIDLVGTDFQQTVWRSLAAIPYGETATYGEQARRIGRPTAARAVGSANARNPLSIVLPCHRVVGADGSMTGFAGGLDTKRFLLDLEARVVARAATA